MDRSEKYKVEVLGITYNQIESGVYAVILQEVGGTRRIPIVIGYPEAQAIECKLQEIVTPRPLTHDLMLDMMHKFNLSIEEVQIKRSDNGVFYADVRMTDGKNVRSVDSRASDAIAIAIRANADIYVMGDVMRQVGFEPEEIHHPEEMVSPEAKTKTTTRPRAKRKTIEELVKEMEAAAEAENYELAAELKMKIEKRRAKK